MKEDVYIWLQIGHLLYKYGFSCDDWDMWSQPAHSYHDKTGL